MCTYPPQTASGKLADNTHRLCFFNRSNEGLDRKTHQDL